MKRRNFIEIISAGTAGISSLFATPLLAAPGTKTTTKKEGPILKIAHITDVHQLKSKKR